MKTRFKVTASKIVAAEDDELNMTPNLGEIDDLDDSFSDQLEDVADTVEDIQDTVTDDDHQEDEHDDQLAASLLQYLQVALETYAGKEGQHEDILQRAIERHLDVEPAIECQGY